RSSARAGRRAAPWASSELLLAEEAGDRVGVEVLDRPVAGAPVPGLGHWLARAGVQARDHVAHGARVVLQRSEQLPAGTGPARLGPHVHALELARAVGQALDTSAAHGFVTGEAD